MKIKFLLLLAAATIGSLTTACDRSHAKNSSASRPGSGASALPGGQPAVKVIALSPKLPGPARSAAAEAVDAEIDYLESEAREGAVVHIIDAEAGRLVATLRAGHGARRQRKQAMQKAAAKVRAFFARQNPQPELDGRLRFPTLCQLLSQAHLPAGTPVIVFGNPLFLNEGADAIFSMKDGVVPTDGHLFLDRKFSLYSVVGRERSLAGLLVYWGFPGDSMFADDSHRQRVARFWSVYLKAQSATLVTFQASLDAPATAAAERRRTPLMSDDPDPRAAPEMLRIVKEIRNRQSANTVTPRATEEVQTRNTADAPDLDRHGNPAGDAHDLIRIGQMAGKRIVFVTFDHDPQMESSPLPGALREKGFEVERVRYPLPQLAAWKAMLASADQVWLISSENTDHFPGTHCTALIERWKAGLALYLAGDNQPYFCEANAVLAAIAPSVQLSGNFPGMQKLGPARNGEVGFVPGSLFHGINAFFEGNTVSSIAIGGSFQPACRHSGGGVLLATLDVGKAGRVVVDGGYTKWFPQYFDQAGAGRLAVNIAGWLAGVDAER